MTAADPPAAGRAPGGAVPWADPPAGTWPAAALPEIAPPRRPSGWDYWARELLGYHPKAHFCGAPTDPAF